MKISKIWLKELLDLKVPIEEVIRLLPLRTIGIKEVTENYIELDMKGYNRADLLSMRGVANEIAAITDSKVKFSDEDVSTYAWVEDFDYESDESINKATTLKQGIKPLKVGVKNPEKCNFYCLAKIEGLMVGPSPKEWVKKLEDSGMRSVNNITDITNIIMLEFGQPLHAFDCIQVKNESITVRTAKKQEKILTLDHKNRTLTPEDLIIADEEKALGIAGVMGGKNSEVSQSTNCILLEAAIFNSLSIRKTSQKLGLSSEASKRFIHGLTQINLLQALSAAIKMYEQIGGKLTAIHIQEREELYYKTIDLNLKKLNTLVGLEFNERSVREILERLGCLFALLPKNNDSLLRVFVPYWRLDIDIEEDLIEEVARMYGYERIKPKELSGKLPEKIDQSLFDLIYNLKTKLVELGLTEIQTYSFYSTQVIRNLKLEIRNLIHIANPISSETEYLRDRIWPNLLEKAAENLKYFKDVAIFEIGKAYQAKPQLQEEYRLSMLLSGDSGDQTPELYQIFEGASTHLRGVKTHLGGEKPRENDYFHPTRFAGLEKDGKEIGFIAEIHPRIANKFGIEKRVAVLEVKV